MGKKYWQKCGGNSPSGDQTIVKPILIWEKSLNHKTLLRPAVMNNLTSIVSGLTDVSKDGNACSPHFVHLDLTPYRSSYTTQDVSHIDMNQYNGLTFNRYTTIWYERTGPVAGAVYGQLHWCGWIWTEDVTANDTDYRFLVLPNGTSQSLGPTDWWDGSIRFVYPYACHINLKELTACRLPYDDYEGISRGGTNLHIMGVRGALPNGGTQPGQPYEVNYVGGDNSNNPRSTKFKSSAHVSIPDAYNCWIVGFHIPNMQYMATGNPAWDIIRHPFKLEASQLDIKLNKYLWDWDDTPVYFTTQETGLTSRLCLAGFFCLTW